MPPFADWFGEWNEPAKKETESSLAARTRYRRDADEAADPPPRESTARPLRTTTFTQPAAMGNFRHQSSLQSLKLDTGSDKDGHERLRNLSDRFDRGDRLRTGGTDLTSLGSARRDRDAAPHLAAGNRQGSSGSLSTLNGTRRVSGREDATPSGRTNGSSGATRQHERSNTLSAKDLSEGRNDRSDDWRRVDRWGDDRRRSRSRDKRSHSREPRRGGGDGWGDRDGWHRSKDEDGRRKDDEAAPIVPLRNTRRERDNREREREREQREREPAWMDDWAPPSANGEPDKLQAWKKSMKEKESAEATTPSAPAPPPADDLNDLERFKLAMKEGAAARENKAPTPSPPVNGSTPTPPVNGAPPGLSLPNDPAIVRAPPPPSDPAIISAASNGVSAPATNGVTLPPLGNGIVEGQSISLKTLGLVPPSSSELSTPSIPQSPPHDSSSVSIFQSVFNANPPSAQANPPLTSDATSRPRSTTTTASIDAKPTAQNVFASFLNEAKLPPKSIEPAADTSKAVGGRTSKFAKFFNNPPQTPKDEAPPPSNTSSVISNHSHQPSLGGQQSPFNYGPNGMMPGQNGLGGLMMGGGRIASPTQHGNMLAQQQQQSVAPPPRMSAQQDPLAGLFANAERMGNGMVGGPVGPTGGTMEGLLAALQVEARGQPRGPPTRFPQQPQQPPQLNKQVNGHFNLQQQQQQFGQQNPLQQQLPPQMFNGLGDDGRFVADGLVPGLRPQRTREQSLTLGGYSEMDERAELTRQFQNLQFNGGMPPQHQQGPLPTQQQLYDQRVRQQQQTLYSNQGQQLPPSAQSRAALANMMGGGGGGVNGHVRPGGGPSPSPINNQNPLAAMQRAQAQAQAQREMMLGAGIGMNGMGGGMGRNPQDFAMRGGLSQDLGGGLGQVRTPQELVHAGLIRGGSADLFNGPPPPQFNAQQQPQRPTPFGGVPNVGAPGTADYMLHNQQLQAARANAAAQQQAQMMQHLGIRGPPPASGPGPRLPPQHMMSDFGLPGGGGFGAGASAGGHGHAHGQSTDPNAFLQLFLGGGNGIGGVGRE